MQQVGLSTVIFIILTAKHVDFEIFLSKNGDHTTLFLVDKCAACMWWYGIVLSRFIFFKVEFEKFTT